MAIIKAEELILFALSGVKDTYICEADITAVSSKKRKRIRLAAAAAAACLCIAAGSRFMQNQGASSTETGPLTENETVSVNPAEGESVLCPTLQYNGTTYTVYEQPDTEVFAVYGLPDTITAGLAGEQIGWLTADADSGALVLTDTQTDITLYAYANTDTQDICIICADGDYYAAIRLQD